MKKLYSYTSAIAMVMMISCSRYAGSFKSNNIPGQVNESFSNFHKEEAVKISVAKEDVLFVSYRRS